MLVQSHATSQQLSGTAELLDESVAVPTTTTVVHATALAPTSGDGASSGLPPTKRRQAALFDHLPEEVAVLHLVSQQLSGAVGLLDEPADVLPQPTVWKLSRRLPLGHSSSTL